MGEQDTNDATLFKDGYDDDEREIVQAVIGKTMLPDRFKKCEDVFKNHGIQAKFAVYPGIGHRTNSEILADLGEFFKDKPAEIE